MSQWIEAPVVLHGAKGLLAFELFKERLMRRYNHVRHGINDQMNRDLLFLLVVQLCEIVKQRMEEVYHWI